MIDSRFTRPGRRNASRMLWVVVLGVVLYLSLYPMSNWALRTDSPWQFLFHMPIRLYVGDMMANIAAYLVFGALTVVAWGSGRKPLLTVLLVSALLSCMSVSVEFMQNWLPRRVPSLHDVFSNSGGAFVGSVAATLLLRWRNRMVGGDVTQVSLAWFEQGPTAGWMLLLIWVATQVPLQPTVLTTGHLPSLVLGSSSAVRRSLHELQGSGSFLSLASMIEILAIACSAALVGLLVMDLVRKNSVRAAWTAALLSLGLLIRIVSDWPVEQAEAIARWLDGPTAVGILLGALTLALFARVPPSRRLLCSAALCLLVVFLVNLMPAPETIAAKKGMARGAFDPAITPGVRALLRWLASAWPWVVFTYFALRLTVSERRQRAHTR